MAVTITNVNRGTVAGDGTGDTAFVGVGKLNDNDNALQTAVEALQALSNEHIDWTNASTDFVTTGSGLFGDELVAANNALTAKLQFKLDSLSATSPMLQFDDADRLYYNRSTNTYNFDIGSLPQLVLSATTANFQDNDLTTTGDMTAFNFNGALIGNADTATAWQTGRTISLTGDVTGTSAAWTGSGNISFATTVVEGNVDHDSLANYLAVEHVDWAVSQGTNIHADNYTNTTYVSSDFTHNSLTGVSANEHIDWTSTTSSLSTSGNVSAASIKAGTTTEDVVIEEDGIYFEQYKHAITFNDGFGNFNLRVGNNGIADENSTETGYLTHLVNTQSTGLWQWQISSASVTSGAAPTWRSQFEIDPSTVSLAYQGSTKLITASGGVTVTGLLAATSLSGTGAAVTGVDASQLSSQSLVSGAATVSSVVGRNASGDIFARMLRSTYDSSNATTTSAFMTRRDNGADNYHRPSYPADARKIMGVHFEKHITIEAPESGNDITWFFTNRAITATEIRLVNRESGTGSCVTTIRHSTDRNATGTIVDTNTVTSNTTGHDITAISDATIPANSFVWVEIGTTTNTDEVHITMIGTYD